VTILQKATLAAIAAGTGCGLVILDQEDKVEYWSPQMEDITRLPADQVVGKSWDSLLLPSGFGEDREEAEMVRADQALPGIIFYPVTGHRKSVTRKIGVLRLTAGPAVAEMETLALFVAKTASGIPNREALSELVLHQLAYWERYRVSFSLLLLKIGNYRSVIGQLGPESWELASRSVYDQLAAYMRMTDKIGLYDESTYWVVLTNTTPEGSRVVADKIRRLVSTMQIGELEHPLEVVVGGVEARAGERVAEMLKRAEQEAAKAAKEASGISFST
jgi:diguanylate cyclase (GGDEF)-like protein